MPAETVRVRATGKGFYHELRKEGDIFDVKEQHRQASWYAPVGLDGKFNKPETDPDSNEDSGLDENDELNLDEGDEDLVGG